MADLQIVDEAAFVAAKMFLECVLPVGLNTQVTTLLATTPGPEESWFMQAIRLVRDDTGEPIIPIKRAYEPCDYHAKTKTPWVCMCRLNNRASWKNPQREQQWAPLWGEHQDTFQAENKGVSVATGNRGFNPETVHRLRERPGYVIGAPVNFIFITIDPAEGGKDEFAIVASCDVGGSQLVVSGCRDFCFCLCAIIASLVSLDSRRGRSRPSAVHSASARLPTTYSMLACSTSA